MGENLLKAAEQLQSYLSAIRRDLHQHPELSWQEHRTTEVIRRHLAEMGVELLPWQGKTGVIGLIRGKRPGPVVALRADIDALPVQEDTGAPYQSKNAGVMHACGHDVHITCLLGAAKLLMERVDDLHGSVRLIFQPSEEMGGGAQSVIDGGVLEGVAAIFGLHNQPDVPAGIVALKEGPLMAGNLPFLIKIQGQGGHGAIPHKTRDPILAAAAVIQNLQTLINRRVNPLEPVVVSFGSIHGGQAANVIPDTVEISGTIRAFDEGVKQEVYRQLCDIAQLTAKSLCTQVEVIPDMGFPPVVNPTELSDYARQTLTADLGGDRIRAAAATMVTEDFAQYQELIPGVMFWLGSGHPDSNVFYSLHNSKFDVDERCLPVGAAAYAGLALSFAKK